MEKIKFDDGYDNNFDVMLCAGCKDIYLHQFKVDSEILLEKCGNEIGTRIFFFCESCDDITILYIYQHEGMTIAETECITSKEYFWTYGNK